MGAQDTFTIEELASAAGMTPRNVRAYRTKGLLAPPTRVGRTSRYQEAHLRRLRDIRQLRDAGLPLKMIIDAAARGEDLGPTGALWQAAGPTAIERGRRRLDSGEPLTPGTGPGGGPGGGQDGPSGSLLVDPEAYALMRTLREAGIPAATVIRVALRAAEAGQVLAQDIGAVLTENAPARARGEEPVAELDDLAVLTGEPSGAGVVDLATTITRGVLGNSGLARP